MCVGEVLLGTQVSSAKAEAPQEASLAINLSSYPKPHCFLPWPEPSLDYPWFIQNQHLPQENQLYLLLLGTPDDFSYDQENDKI